ncbi:hypothetical protein ASE14_09800 [Agromyces sp. Root81]|uniref:cupin domain-containing protein n=1 Tax=Agromyces sp. Root81 TaxID=1736601 RepID=UPI0006F3F527|nr:cupin domain-containing protein [Agromyces sp. Root81]KRC61210.1 hypothetical protein ASE14_09800 [Agromyces sp. Root81]
MTAFPRPVLIEASAYPHRNAAEMPEDLVLSGRPTADVWAPPPLVGARAVTFGVWLGQPGSVACHGYPHDEVFVVAEGLIRLESLDGTSLDVEPGQSCFVPRGWRGVWHTVSPTRKTYVIAASDATE